MQFLIIVGCAQRPTTQSLCEINERIPETIPHSRFEPPANPSYGPYGTRGTRIEASAQSVRRRPHDLRERLTIRPVWMQRSVTDRFIDDDIAVPNFDVVEAVWVGANPGLELNRRALATEIRERNQITCTALPTARKRELNPHRPVLTLQAMLIRPTIHDQRCPHPSRRFACASGSRRIPLSRMP